MSSKSSYEVKFLRVEMYYYQMIHLLSVNTRAFDLIPVEKNLCAKMCITVRECVEVCQTVPICAKQCQSVPK